MGTPIGYYVDPAAGSDLMGSGTKMMPWASIQYALDTGITRDATHGDQINLKAGSDDVLNSTLDFSTYGSSDWGSPLIIRGYTTDENDGGVGGISGDDSYQIAGAGQFHHYFDLHMHSTGSNTILSMGTYSTVYGCEFDNTTGGGIDSGSVNGSRVIACHFHNIGGSGVQMRGEYGSEIKANYFKNGSNEFSDAVFCTGAAMEVSYNIISIGGASNGINFTTWGNTIYSNSVLSSGGTGYGIDIPPDGVSQAVGNCIEGFSGTGGKGFKGTGGGDITLWGLNACYNNETEYSALPDVHLDLGDNETLSASPFAKTGSDTFANRATYFAAADTGNVRGGGYPSGYNLDKGAVQSAGGGGGSTTNVFIPAASGRFGVRES